MTEKKPLKVKVETVLIIIAMTGLVLTGITIGNRIHHHQMLRDIRIKFEQLHDRIEDQDTGNVRYQDDQNSHTGT